MQQEIIERLQIASCRLITDHELYRIRELSIQAPELKAGDFAGLVNLTSLRIEVRPPEEVDPSIITAGAFSGSRVKRLTIEDDVTFENGAFDGAHVEILEVELESGRSVYDQQTSQVIGYRAPGRLPSRLPESLTELVVEGDLRLMDWQVFQTLPELEALSLSHDEARPEGTPTPAAVFTIPVDAFADNPKLRSLELQRDSSWGTGSLQIDAGLLAEHQHLARVQIDRLTVEGQQPDGFPIRLHPDSPAFSYIAEHGIRNWSYWENGQDFRLP